MPRRSLRRVLMQAGDPLRKTRLMSEGAAFTPDGRWLYFLSDRELRSVVTSPWGDRNMGPYFDRRTRIYALALQPAHEGAHLRAEGVFGIAEVEVHHRVTPPAARAAWPSPRRA